MGEEKLCPWQYREKGDGNEEDCLDFTIKYPLQASDIFKEKILLWREKEGNKVRDIK